MSTLLNSTVGGYRLVDFLGAGGMGEVYRGVHSKIGRIVAVKVLTHAARDSSFTDRFINEARIQSSLHHPHIATLYDFLEVNGRPCILMEYVDGQTLYERIKARGPLPLAETLSVFQAVIEAVAYLHGQGIVHRDIKSNNIKITSTGKVKLLDFGIAKDATTPRLTMTGHYVGTLHYLAPEQISGKPADMRADVWSLGVLLFEMSTGKLPFEATSISEFCDKISKATYPKPSLLNPSVPAKVEAILAHCLRKNPEERYPSARELLNSVRNLSAVVPKRRNKVDQQEFEPIGRGLMVSVRQNLPLIAVVTVAFSLLLTSLFFLGGKPGRSPEKPFEAVNLESLGSSQSAEIRARVSEVDQKRVPIVIDTYDGVAEVYERGSLVGKTRFEKVYPVGSKIDLELRRAGYQSKVVQFEVREVGNQYSYGLEKENRK